MGKEDCFEHRYSYGVHFSARQLEMMIFSQSAQEVILHLFKPKEEKACLSRSLSSNGDGLWSVCLETIPDIFLEYLFEIDGCMVIDPYATALSGPFSWGEWGNNEKRRCQFTFDHVFDWGNDRPVRHQDLIIYEMHVRGFTQHVSSDCRHRGTYLGLIEKIPYLKGLGINAIELMPVHEFDERENARVSPKKNLCLWNYWGYSTVNFFCPMKRYASNAHRLSALRDFQFMVRELHSNGIAVILDVVYNHVSGLSDLEKIDKASYFILDGEQNHTNFSGCGNTLSVNSCVVTQLMLDSLRYFVQECHVDGFRFDLAGCFARGHDGTLLADSPILQKIFSDPILSSCILILEPWDCFGYNISGVSAAKHFWIWNDYFCETVRQFVRGDGKKEHNLQDCWLGSPGKFLGSRCVKKSINYVTCHDGFSLRDLVSYNEKHNFDNGENNLDGNNNNHSCNYGKEGRTTQTCIENFRIKQMRNFFFINLLSFGVPMIRSGDEYGQTLYGNNNTYCQDALNWFRWDLHKKRKELFHFVKMLIQVRKASQLYERCHYLTVRDYQFLFIQPHVIVCLFRERYLIALNASTTAVNLKFCEKKTWKILLQTCHLPVMDDSCQYLCIAAHSCFVAYKHV